MRWTLVKKRRVQVFLLVFVIGVIAIGINHFFFKNMRFIQSEVYPNLYLVKYPDKDYSAVEKAIQEKVKEHLNTEHKTGKLLSYTGENAIYFYEYGGMTFGFIGDAGTGYFIDHEEDLGGFVTEELGIYRDYRLAEFYYNPCPQDSSLGCGEINYFNQGDFVRADTLTNLVLIPSNIKHTENHNIPAEQKKSEVLEGKNEGEVQKVPIHGILDNEALAKYYPRIFNEYDSIGNFYAQRVALTNKYGAIVSLLQRTDFYTDYYLYTHNKDSEAIDSFYIGKATDFDNGKSETIDYKILKDSSITFNKVVWGMIKQDHEKVIDTLAHETTTLWVNPQGGLDYHISNSPKHFTLKVFLMDSDPNGTHLRDAPKGNIVHTLDPTDEYVLSVVKGENGWFRVLKIEGVESGEIHIQTAISWAHSSVMRMRSNRNISVLDSPKSGEKIGVIEANMNVRILELNEDWVKIEYQGVQGWAAAEMFCGNPVTTCP